ncbi:DMT family transporter [Streptomyces sp. NPDC059740]|uniref:DMT family transporter n=1 Tax=Streptomyces sp. NPDC059740 TaxID=3346926 RepID=UPI00365B35EF
MLVWLLALSAACCLGFGFVLQQRAAQNAPVQDFLSLRLLWDLAHMPIWLAGIGAMIVGMVLNAWALGVGEITLVEPLIATNLLFAMALSRRITKAPLGWSGWLGLLLLAGGVTAFIVAGQPKGGNSLAGPLRHWLIMGSVLGAALLLAGLSRRFGMAVEAGMLGVSGGLLYGLQDGLTRICGNRVDDGGLGDLFTSWEPYALVGLGVTSLVIVQSAFEAAPLRMSLPALTASQPLAGILCGVGFLGDQLRVTVGALAWQAVGLVAIIVGIVVISHHPAMPRGGEAVPVHELEPH